VIPGEFFGMDRYLRLRYGYGAEHLQAALRRVDELIETLRVMAG